MEHLSQSATSHQPLATWLNEYIPHFMAQCKLPGFSIAVVHDGAVIFADGFGARDPGRNRPATADTLYGIGSVTKSFVALGILQLAEAGKLDLHDPVADHIPCTLGLPDAPITIHHLLTHSLGLPSLATSTLVINKGLGLESGIPLGSANDFYRFVNGAQAEIVAKPGERFFYHNAGYRMLGHLIQEKSGLPFHEYLQERVIAPLGMARTTFDVAAAQADPDHAIFHRKTATGANEPAPFPYPNPVDNPAFSFLSAAGGLFSSVNELAAYVQLHLAMGRTQSPPLLSPESFAQMQTAHVSRPAQNPLPDGTFDQQGYGYGLAITPNFFGHKLVAHDGSVVVSTASLALMPDLNAGVVMMGNGAGMPYATIFQSIFAILLGKEPAAVIPALQIEDRMAQLTGTYETYRGIETIRVINKGGLLYTEATDPVSTATTLTPLIPEDPTLASTNFYTLSNGVKTPVEFWVDERGVIRLIIERYCYRKVG
jgi:CubicO group peptidase (beta-lactamase class C family)